MADNQNTGAVDHRHLEQSVEEHRRVFKKELGLTDLVLTQILFIVGLPWIGVAAEPGSSDIILWLGAMLLFDKISRIIEYLSRRSSAFGLNGFSLHFYFVPQEC